MTHQILPRPSIVDQCIFLRVEAGRKLWCTPDHTRYYTWDTLHGELEVFNARGRHLGSIDPITGEFIKPAVKGRKFNV